MMQRVVNSPILGAIVTNGIQPHRGMATLKVIQMRLKSVKNIQKITQSMKMVSAAKYARAERDLKQARPYGEGAKGFYDVAEIQPDKESKKELYIAMTSDRGLCGAVHTGVARQIRNELNAKENADDAKIICVGDKSRAVLQRGFGKKFIFVANEVGRIPPTFLDASKIAIEVLNSGFDFTHGKIVYNKFRTVVSYNLSEIPIFSLKSVESSDKLVAYDSLDAEIIRDYLEYSLASLLFYAMKLSIVGAVSFLVGYLRQDIKLSLYIGLAGTVAVFLLVVPPWPFFNRNPVKWLPIGGGAAAAAGSHAVPQNLVFSEKAVQ